MHGSTPASDVHEQLKTNGTAIKIAIETTDNKKKHVSAHVLVKRVQRQQFSFATISIKVSLKILILQA